MRAGCKACGRCREVKSMRLFYKRKQGARRVPDSWCKDCRRSAGHADYRHRREDPERWAAELSRIRAYRQRRYRDDPEFRQREIDRHRRYLERLPRTDPRRHHQILEDARVRAKLQRERQGLTIRPADADWVGAGNYLMLDPGPVVAFVDRFGGTGEAALGDETLARALRRIVSGESERAELATVDQLVIAHGLLLHDLYDPDKYPELYE